MTTPPKDPSAPDWDSDWVIVQHEEQSTGDRCPQYNEDNESKEQIASSRSALDDPMVNEEGDEHPTETEDSVDTMTGPGAAGPEPVTPSSYRPVTLSLPVTLPLTKITLGLCNKQPRQGYYLSIDEWCDDAAVRLRMAEESDSSTYESMLASTVSSISLDTEPSAPVLSSTHDVFGVGMWAVASLRC